MWVGKHKNLSLQLDGDKSQPDPALRLPVYLQKSGGAIAHLAPPVPTPMTVKVPELAFFLPSLHCQLQEDKATWRWCTFLGNVSVTTYDLI